MAKNLGQIADEATLSTLSDAARLYIWDPTQTGIERSNFTNWDDVKGFFLSNVSGDASPELGGNLDAQTFNITNAGKVGIGTSAVPHGSVGGGKLAIEGTDASVASGPHAQWTTAVDNYPLMQILAWQHNNVSIAFDAYYDGTWRSSALGSNFRIAKISNELVFTAETNISGGQAITWDNVMKLRTNNNVQVTNSLEVDTIIEKVASSGVTIDGVLLKDGGIVGLSSLSETLTNKTISGASNTFSNIDLATAVTGNLPVTHFDGGTNASSSTVLFGDGTWGTPSGSGTSTQPQAAVSASRNIAIGDLGKLLRVDTSTGAVTLTVESGLAADFICFVQRAAGTNNIVITGQGGVTFNGLTTITQDKDPVTIWQDASNSYDIWGNEPISIIDDTTPTLGGYLDLNNKGITIEETAGETVAAKDICYLKSDGKFWKANATGVSTTKGMLAMSTATISGDDTGTFLIRGIWPDTGLTVGGEYYMAETAGAKTVTIPTGSGTMVRLLGYGVSATKFFFDPDKTYLENP